MQSCVGYEFPIASDACAAFCIGLAAIPQTALAGPPFLTDDPEPTEPRHWEIYAPQIKAQGRGGDFTVSLGAELNYGAAPNLQLTLGLPIDYAHSASGLRWGRGDVELSAKYRFFHDKAAGLQIAIFPGATLPSGSNGLSSGTVTALLPVWGQKGAGAWSIFGGGYAINPGAGNSNYWTGGVAVTRRIGARLLIGTEINRQGRDTVGGEASTSLGLGAIYRLKAPFRILASGGPTLGDRSGRASFHLFVALGVDL